MKLNKIMLFFCLALPASVLMRFFQLRFTIDEKTGFFTEGSGNNGLILLILIFLFCFAAALFASFVHNRPENPPRINIGLSISSLLLTISILNQVIFETFTITTVYWQILLIKLLGILSVLFFVLYAVSPFVNLRIPKVLFTIPAIYIISRMIYDFTVISKLALISDNILLIASYCVVLLFMLNFAKLYNNADNERNFKKLLSTGVASVISCFTYALPSLSLSLVTAKQYHQISTTTGVMLLFTGLFILTFLLSHFSKKNLTD